MTITKPLTSNDSGVDAGFFVKNLLVYLLRLERCRVFGVINGDETDRLRRFTEVLHRMYTTRLPLASTHLVVPASVPLRVAGAMSPEPVTSSAIGVHEVVVSQRLPEATRVSISLGKRTVEGTLLYKDSGDRGDLYAISGTSLKDKEQLFAFVSAEVETMAAGILKAIPEGRRGAFIQSVCGVGLDREWRKLYVHLHQFEELSRKALSQRLKGSELKDWLASYVYVVQHLLEEEYTPMYDKRQSVRVPLVLPVSVAANHGTKGIALDSYTMNIGMGGVTLRVPEAFAARGKIDLTLHEGDTPLLLRGKLNWVRDTSAGIVFDGVSRKARDRLFDRIFSHLRELLFVKAIRDDAV